MAEEETGLSATLAKRRRSQLSEELSKQMQELADTSGKSKEDINEALDNLRVLFKDFTAAHIECVTAVTSNDARTKLKSDFDRVSDEYDKCTKKAQDQLSSILGKNSNSSAKNQPSPSDTQQFFLAMQAQNAQMMQMMQMMQEQNKKNIEQMFQMFAAQKADQISSQCSTDNTVGASETETHVVTISESADAEDVSSPPEPQEKTVPHSKTSGLSENQSVAETAILQTLSQFASAIQASHNTPRPEISPFSGNPQDYKRFICSFESGVEAHVRDASSRLTYLIQFCTGEARSLIEDFVSSDGQDGYRQAREALRSRYGQPYLIARAYVDRLTKGPEIKSHDVKALNDLAIDMQKCKQNMPEMGPSSDINSSGTLRAIVNRLPKYLRTKWTEVAFSINEAGREPNFLDLAKFVDERSRVASSMYAVDAHKEERNRPKTQQASKHRSTTLSTHASSSQSKNCIYCSKNCTHVSKCSEFTALSLSDRVSAVRKLRLCINCLAKGHFRSDCRKPAACNVPGCDKKHHRLLHSWTPNHDSQAASSVSVAAARCDKSKKATFLGIIPIRVQGKNGKVVQTNALLDNGSQQSFCSEKLLRKLGINRKRVKYNVTTLTSQNQQHSGFEVNLTVQLLSNYQWIRLDGVWSIKN